MEGTDLTTRLLALLWALIVTTAIPIYKTIIKDKDILSNFISELGIVFCPGLMEVLAGDAPPAIEWFESLSGDIPNYVWGVYVLVLRKPDCRPLLYVGSGTQNRKGVRNRILFHFRSGDAEARPKRVREATENGYRIVHAALLAHAPAPPTGRSTTLRFAMIALEAAFSVLFWAFVPSSKLLLLGFRCPWPPHAFTYGGLCTHNPLTRPPMGPSIDLTAEQLEEMEEIRRQELLAYHREYARTMRERDPEA
ncbi:hypothetical protein VTJ49DRAFT_5379 [Mycothermus thermophilus]|uniref:GIY-YIG domain-containing protein n=1 Tax=Humicola insolens TaxID=85995 RepID=A0ABR3V3A3_HUMIN